MTGQIDIHYGGAIAVDPEVLRDVGARIAGVATRFGEAEFALSCAHAVIVGAPGLDRTVDTWSLQSCRYAVQALRLRCDETAAATLLMADVYELVELRTQADMLALTDRAAADALMLRIDRLEASDPRLAPMADALIAGWKDGRYEGLDDHFDFGGLASPLLVGAPLLAAMLGLGVVPKGATLSGTADAVRVTPVRTSTPVTAPGSLADAFRRMPRAEGAQLAVEKQVREGGRERYVVYIKGTQNITYGGTEPWDMKSNSELYGRQKSASYQATVDALKDAGAGDGDEVVVVAHSQAGMIGAYLESEGHFDVSAQITAGSPVSPVVDDSELLVQLGYTDDFVRSLAGGGTPGGSGSPDSFTVTADDAPVLGHNLLWDPHLLESYIEMAEKVDDSDDPRAIALDDLWRDLGQADTIERTEYHAERTDPAPSGDPHAYIDHLAR